MKPKVSLIMGVYNGSPKLKESIDSILSQTLSDFELIIINDASTDGTQAILEEYQARDARVKIVKNEKNLGLTKSLNRGILASTGGYVARMDNGDISYPTRFGKQVLFLDTHPEYCMVGSFANLTNDKSEVIGQLRYPSSHEAISRGLIRHNLFVHSSVMMRRDALDKVGLYNEDWRYAQDYELFFRMIQIGKVANIPEALVSYRISEESITKSKNKKQVMFAIHARYEAIKRGQYSILSLVFLVPPFIGYLLPYSFKQTIKKIFHI